MIVRTQLGEIYASFSNDRGESWSKAEPWGIRSPRIARHSSTHPGHGRFVARVESGVRRGSRPWWKTHAARCGGFDGRRADLECRAGSKITARIKSTLIRSPGVFERSCLLRLRRRKMPEGSDLDALSFAAVRLVLRDGMRRNRFIGLRPLPFRRQGTLTAAVSQSRIMQVLRPHVRSAPIAKTPAGVAAISRGLSAATSPVQNGSCDIAEPEGFAATRCCDPFRVDALFSR